jgi:UPF0755 protein
MRRALVAVLVLACLVLLAGGAAWLWLERWTAAPGPLAEPATVDLPHGIGVRGIAGRLAAAGVVDRALAFEAAARLHDRDRRLQAGEYRFGPGASPAEVLDALEAGRVLLHALTVPEGLTVREVLELIGAAEILTGDLPEPPSEGSLLPETYHVRRGQTRGEVVDLMRAAMDRALAEVWATRAAELPLEQPRDAVILASIIERETSVEAEYPIVAAVFVNRLRRGMRLQTDPTVIYGLAEGKGSIGRPLTRADLAAEHPYNTYLIDGLPPGPIANPGRGALEAAVAPAEVDYLYFVADGSGGHAFARTLAEHNRNVARWRRIRDEAGATPTP